MSIFPCTSLTYYISSIICIRDKREMSLSIQYIGILFSLNLWLWLGVLFSRVFRVTSWSKSAFTEKYATSTEWSGTHDLSPRNPCKVWLSTKDNGTTLNYLHRESTSCGTHTFHYWFTSCWDERINVINAKASIKSAKLSINYKVIEFPSVLADRFIYTRALGNIVNLW